MLIQRTHYQNIKKMSIKSGLDSANMGMALFDKKFHPDRLYNIGTDGIPMEDFLLMNPSDLF